MKKEYLQYMKQIKAKNTSLKDVLIRTVTDSKLHENIKQDIIQDLKDIETLNAWADKLTQTKNIVQKLLIGQRVILNGNEIGKVCAPLQALSKGIWVYSHIKKYPSLYDSKNVKPLPNGQL